MTKILIFGASGFIGEKLVTYFSLKGSIDIAKIDEEEVILLGKIKKSDIIINASGVSRSENENDFFLYNIYHAQRIFSIINKFESKMYIYFSSIHYATDSIYGVSKRYNEFLLNNLGFEKNNYFLCLRIPSVFGPGLKPNYVSVVATFCYNVANNIKSIIVDENKVIKLLYVDDLIRMIEYKIKYRKANGYEILTSFEEAVDITVGSLYKKIEGIDIHDLHDPNHFTYNLQTTYKFYLNKI